jgi:hypothetical protein
MPGRKLTEDFVLSALAATPKATEKFYFWTGSGKLESIVRSWRTPLRRSSSLQTYRMDMRIDFPTHSLLSYAPLEYRLKEFPSCWAIRAYESRKSTKHLGYDRAKNNERQTWRVRGVGTHSCSQKARYSRSTLKETIHSISTGDNGARGGSRTHMRKNPRRILSPQRLPFRHPGNVL